MSTVKDPVLNTGFKVQIGNQTFSFARIRNISQTIDVETIQEGGNNWLVHNLPKPLATPQRLVLEHGFLADEDNEPGFTVGSRLYNVTIMVMRHNSVSKTYSFDEGVVTRWELSDFDAMQGQIVYNTIEILHSGLH